MAQVSNRGSTRKGGGGKGKKGKKGKNPGGDDDGGTLFYDAFELIWKKRELPFEDHLPPKPTEDAKEETSQERIQFENSQEGTPHFFKHRFFLVGYGIEMLEHYRTQRSLHMQLIGYTIFVINFLLYTWNNVAVNEAVHVKDAYLQAIVEYPYLLGTESFDERSGAIPKRTMANVGSRENILPWMKKAFVSSPYGPYGKNTSLGYIGLHNRVIGAIRLQQVRTKTDSCVINPALGSAISASSCFTSHAPSNTDKKDYGPGTAKAAWNSAPMVERVGGKYKYREESELVVSKYMVPVDGESTFNAPTSLTPWPGLYGNYEHGGFAVDLPRDNSEQVNDIIDQLVEDSWVDDSTAFVTLSMTTYNAHLNIFMYAQMYFECPPSGFINSGAIFRPFKMPGNQYKRPSQESDDINRVMFSMWVVLAFLWFIYRMVYYYKESDIWDLIDVVNLSLLTLQFLNRLAWEQTFPIVINFDSYGNTNEYVNFYQLSWLFESERLLTGVNGVLVFIKYFKLTRVVVRLSMIVHVLEVAARELFSWILISGLLFFSFAFSAHIGFGATLFEFHSLTRSAMTLFNYMIGLYEQSSTSVTDLTYKTGYESLEYAGLHASIFFAGGSFFYIAFNVCFYFLLTRILVAMLISAYSRVLREIERDEEMEAELGKMQKMIDDHIPKTWHNSCLGKLWFLYLYRKDEYNILARLKSSPELIDKGYLSYAELREALDGTVEPDELDPSCMRLMNLQRIHLHRVPGVTALLKQRMWSKATSLEEYVQNGGAKGAKAQAHHERLLAQVEESDGVFAMENWNRDVMSGDVLHSAIFVFRTHLEEDFKRFSVVLKGQQRSLRQIMEQLILIETRIGQAYEHYTGTKIEYKHFETEKGKQVFEEYHAKIREEKEKKAKADFQMMRGELEDDEEKEDGDEEKDVGVNSKEGDGESRKAKATI
jgi:hypothetical protein